MEETMLTRPEVPVIHRLIALLLLIVLGSGYAIPYVVKYFGGSPIAAVKSTAKEGRL